MDDVRSAALPAAKVEALKRQVLAATLADIKTHHAWSDGLAVQSMSSALKPEHVLAKRSVSDVNRASRLTLETMFEAGLAPGRCSMVAASFTLYSPGPGLGADGSSRTSFR